MRLADLDILSQLFFKTVRPYRRVNASFTGRVYHILCTLFVTFYFLNPLDLSHAHAQHIPYTTSMVAEHTINLQTSPFVTPTLSGDRGFVIGQSLGWPDSPSVPPHDLYGYKITDPNSARLKTTIVMISGNHGNEGNGNWGLQGAVDFWVSDDPRANDLRQSTELFVYPMVNPDGRTVNSRGNPELESMGLTDHNRVWNLSGISTIDVLTTAMRSDTGGDIDYLFDFHMAGNDSFLGIPELVDSDFSLAMTSRGHVFRSSNGAPGMTRIWAMSESGLNATYSFTPEYISSRTAQQVMDIGEEFSLGLHDVIVLVADPSGDFDRDGILDTNDIDQLTVEALAGTNDPSFDLNDDGIVDQSDRTVWVHELRDTYFGDTNLDGEFNSGDMVAVFTIGKYETQDVAGWADGDWNGDGNFTSGDFVAAFTDGGYEQGPRPAANTVPEPTSFAVLVIGLIGIATVSRTRRIGVCLMMHVGKRPNLERSFK